MIIIAFLVQTLRISIPYLFAASVLMTITCVLLGVFAL